MYIYYVFIIYSTDNIFMLIIRTILVAREQRKPLEWGNKRLTPEVY